MCFSGRVSFFASFSLAIVGILTLLKAKKKRQIPLAMIPLIFAIQQLAEAMLWNSLQTNNNLIATISTYVFLFFAYSFWPMWAPFSLLLIEKNKLRKKIIFLLLIIGILVFFYNLIFLFYYGAQAQIINKHIYYTNNIPYFFKIGYIFYLTSLILPFFISSIPLMWVFGLSAIISLIISLIFYTKYLTSIWCFFAAILSSLIYFIVLKLNKNS